MNQENRKKREVYEGKYYVNINYTHRRLYGKNEFRTNEGSTAFARFYIVNVGSPEAR